jgi:hypothetical protein
MALLGDFKLTPRQEKVLASLITEPSINEAANAARVGVRTVFKWLKNEAFCDAYRAARAAAVRQAVGQVQAAMGAAVRTLVEIMEDTGAPASSRVTAAKAMIETGIKAVEIEDIEARLSVIETEIKKERYKR